jgi:hypothetical protein
MENPPDNESTAPDTLDVIDEAMSTMSDFISQMTELDGHLVDDEMGAAMRVEKAEMSMPVQLDFHINDDGSVVLGAAPPLYYVHTTISPVFHQLKVEITASENVESNADSDKQ